MHIVCMYVFCDSDWKNYENTRHVRVCTLSLSLVLYVYIICIMFYVVMLTVYLLHAIHNNIKLKLNNLAM